MPEALQLRKYLRLRQIIGTADRPGPVPVARATWYSWVRQGKAPKPVRLGPRTSVWRESDIADFLNARDNFTPND